MKLKPDIATMLKFYTIITFPFGLTRLKYENLKIQTTGINYKRFVITIIIITCVLSPWLLYYNYNIMIDHLHFEKSLIIISVFNESSLLVNYLSIVVFSFFVERKFSKSIYENLIDVDRQLGKMKIDKYFRTKLILFNFSYICLNMFLVSVTAITWSKIVIWPIQIMVIPIDLEEIRFLFEINLISKRFKILNQKFISTETNRSNNINIDYDIMKRLCQHIGRKDEKNQIFFNNGKFEYLALHNKLIGVLENFNSSYSPKVHVIFQYRYC